MNTTVRALGGAFARFFVVLAVAALGVASAHSAVTVSITAPSNGAVFAAGSNITLSANASATGGYTISKVEFFRGGTTLIGTDTSSPYSIIWNNVPAGSYTLTAKATAIKKNNPDQTATSSPISITVNAPLAAAGLYFIHADHLNTPRAIYNDQQQLAWRWDQQEPFGNSPPNENPSGLGTLECNIRFAGQYFDKETNLSYNYFRDFDPGLGRYAQSDPIGITGGLNTYAYVDGSPLRFSDSTGLFLDAEALARAAKAASRVAPAAAAAALADGPAPVGDLIAVGIVAGAVILELCADRDDCLEIQRRIERALAELRKRYVAMTADKNRTYWTNMFGALGWDNHRKAIEEWKRNLAKNVALAKAKGCPYDPEADKWILRSPPERPAY